MGHQWAPEQPIVDDRRVRPPVTREGPSAADFAGMGVAQRIDGGSRAQLFGALQRTVGNAAIISAGVTRAPAVAVTVQRCGDTPPESCPCHDNDAEAADAGSAGPESASASHTAP